MYRRVMGEPTPRGAAERLLRRQSRQRPTNPSGVVDTNTVQFAVERFAPGRCVLGVTLKDMNGSDRCLLFFGVQEDDGSWQTRTARLDLIDEPGRRGGLLYDFGASPNAIDFVGLVMGRAASLATSVRLTLRNGRIIDRPVEGGWAALATDGELSSPIIVDLLDDAGTLLWTDSYSTAPYPGTPSGQTR
jgi:hypothetical protein